jgi:hypothetical protein
MKYICGIIIFCMLSQVSFAETTQTTPTPHTQYPLLYTFNAQHGVVNLQPDRGYQLILQDVHPLVTYQIHTTKNKSNTLPIKQFLSQWQNKKIASVTGDLTGVQVAQNIGHQQFYQTVRLSHPQYNSKKAEMTFTVIFTQPNKPANALEEMDNATLFINGCDICSCRADKITCN